MGTIQNRKTKRKDCAFKSGVAKADDKGADPPQHQRHHIQRKSLIGLKNDNA